MNTTTTALFPRSLVTTGALCTQEPIQAAAKSTPGVPPDIEVEQHPAEFIAGRDPQLEKAIEVTLEQLRQNPPPNPVRPETPTRARK